MARYLASLPLDDLLDPRQALARIPEVLHGRHPSWDNGLVDRWDGATWVHTAAVAAGDYPYEILTRVWRGQVRAAFPFLEQVRTAFVARYEDRLRGALPLTRTFHDREIVYEDPWKLEYFQIRKILEGALSEREVGLLQQCNAIRTCMAHHEPADAWRIKRMSDAWEDMSPNFPEPCHAWDWPRCGQKLVLMIGPSGAGKSTWTRGTFDEALIVSSDDIREEMFGTTDMGGDQGRVFAKVRRTAKERLSKGNTVVIDATNLKREDRLPNARLVPPDIPVEYVLVDRPMAEKIATARQGTEREKEVMEIHAGLLERGLSDILAGDALPNVTVVDLRKFAKEDGGAVRAVGD
jgi:predicted kinase